MIWSDQRSLRSAPLRRRPKERAADLPLVLGLMLAVFWVVQGPSPALLGQEQVTEEVTEELVQLNFPNEIDIKTLVDYVSDRLQIAIFYDEKIEQQRITVRAPQGRLDEAEWRLNKAIDLNPKPDCTTSAIATTTTDWGGSSAAIRWSTSMG